MYIWNISLCLCESNTKKMSKLKLTSGKTIKVRESRSEVFNLKRMGNLNVDLTEMKKCSLGAISFNKISLITNDIKEIGY